MKTLLLLDTTQAPCVFHTTAGGREVWPDGNGLTGIYDRRSYSVENADGARASAPGKSSDEFSSHRRMSV